jgi:transcription termination factor Rho
VQKGTLQRPPERLPYRSRLPQYSLFEDPEKARHKVNFDNLTPLYPEKWLKMEYEDPTKKDLSARVIDIRDRLARAAGLTSYSPKNGQYGH